MIQKETTPEFRIGTPATYRIRVQGRLDPRWDDLLDYMRILPSDPNDNVTTLMGRLPDQAALSGVLNALYDRLVPLLSVENLDEKNDESQLNPEDTARGVGL